MEVDDFFEIVEAAEAGKADAQNQLGECYYWGTVVNINHEQALLWYKKSASQNYIPALYNLGVYYAYFQNDEVAREFYEKAAHQNYPKAQFQLGMCYYNGKGVQQNYKEAISWFIAAAREKEVDALNAIGRCYKDGNGVNEDLDKAKKWFADSAQLGNAEAEFNYASILFDEIRYSDAYSRCNDNELEKLFSEPLSWYKKAAEQNYYEAEFELGQKYDKYDINIKEKCLYWWERAASHGHDHAQRNLGSYYLKENNQEQAIYWFLKSAANGNTTAYHDLAEYYCEKQDYKESIKWLIKIVNEKKEELDNIRNHSLITAYRELGKIYRDCKEVQNNELSIKYFMQAARLGADVTSDIKKLYIKQ